MDEPQPERGPTRTRESIRTIPLPDRVGFAPGLVGIALTLTLGLAAAPAGAQSLSEAPPSGYAAFEAARSRSCVTTFAELDRLDATLDPLAQRSRRLLGIAEAISIEDRSVVTWLNPLEPTESAVRDWFVTDSVLAERFVTSRDTTLQQARGRGREVIKKAVTDALTSIQQQADSTLAENQELMARAAPCDGAILVRPVVIEACATEEARVCTEAAAAPAAEDTRFRFVDSPEEVWEHQELRPWTTPGPLRMGPSGLDGARTVGYARIGNVVLTTALAPLIREGASVTPAERVRYDQTNQALGLALDHPDLVFTPALAMRAALPEPVSGEERYLLHFGSPEEPEVLWTGEAGTGVPLEASLPLQPAQVLRLRAGDPLALTAVRGGGNEPVFSIALSEMNQGAAVQALLAYLGSTFPADVKRLVPPAG